MSLSPLYRTLTNDLHVSNARPTSIAVSSDFVVARNRSPPFGSYRRRLRSTGRPEDSITSAVTGDAVRPPLLPWGRRLGLFVLETGRPRKREFFSFGFRAPPERNARSPQHRFHHAQQIHSTSRTLESVRFCYDSRLLGPCYKTGGDQPIHPVGVLLSFCPVGVQQSAEPRLFLFAIPNEPCIPEDAWSCFLPARGCGVNGELLMLPLPAHQSQDFLVTAAFVTACLEWTGVGSSHTDIAHRLKPEGTTSDSLRSRWPDHTLLGVST